MSLVGIERWRPENWESHEALCAALLADAIRTRRSIAWLYLLGLAAFVGAALAWKFS